MATRSSAVLGGISIDAPVRERTASRMSDNVEFSVSMVRSLPSHETTGGCGGACSGVGAGGAIVTTIEFAGKAFTGAGSAGVEAPADELEGVEFRSEEHTSELQSPYVISYAVFCLKKKKN